MSKKPDHSPLKWVASAVFLATFVSGLSIYFASGAQDWDGDLSFLSLKDLAPNNENLELNSEDTIELASETLGSPGDYLQTAPQNMRLGVLPGEIDTKLRSGNHVEVYSFSLSSLHPYTLRSIPFEVYGEELSESFMDVENWELYLEDEQGSQLVGVGESFEDGFLKVRLTGEWPYAYFAQAGLSTFTLTSQIETETEDAWLKIQIVEDEGIGWQWIPGHYQGSWLNPEGVVGSDQIDGLPGVRLERH